MSNSEQGQGSHATETALLAAFVTVVLATGSAFVWRSSKSRCSHSLISSSTTAGSSLHALSCEQTCIMPPRPKPTTTNANTALMKVESVATGAAKSEAVKQARSKERRKRGKDPLKELLKAERKGKNQAKLAVDGQPVVLDVTDHNRGRELERQRERSNSVSTASSSRHPASQDHEYERDHKHEHISAFADPVDGQHNDDSTSISASTSASSTSTANTSPDSSLILTPEPVISSFEDVVAVAHEHDPWDWDANSSSAYSSSTTNESPQKKRGKVLPRFRSRSRQRQNADDAGKASGSSSETLALPAYNSNGNAGAKTPLRTPTPSTSGTPPPSSSLSLQTQLASLKGALEAARLREDNMKKDMDKYYKEMELLKWENRRREVELQSQIQGLLHQLHAYSMFAPPPAFSSLSNHTTPPPTTTMFASSSSASPGYHQQPHPWAPAPSPTSNLMSPTHPPSSPYMSQQQQLYSTMFANGFASGCSSPSTSSPDLSGRSRRRGRGHGGGNTNASIHDDGWILTSSMNLKGEMVYEQRSGTPLDFDQLFYQDGAGGLGGAVDDDDDEVNGLLVDAIMKRPETIRLGHHRHRQHHPAQQHSSEEEESARKASPNRCHDGGSNDSPLEELTFPSIADSMYAYSSSPVKPPGNTAVFDSHSHSSFASEDGLIEGGVVEREARKEMEML